MPKVKWPRRDRGLESNRTLLLAGFGRGADGSGLGAFQNGVGALSADVEDNQSDRGAHEDDCRPGGEAGKHVGRGAGSKGGLRTLTTEGAGQISRTALLKENNANQEETHDDVDNDHEVEENLHF